MARSGKSVSESLRHGVDFVLLLLILSIGLLGLLFFNHQIFAQIAIVLMMCVLYVFWGITHHLIEKSLTSKVVWEYIGVASLVGFVLILFLLRT